MATEATHVTGRRVLATNSFFGAGIVNAARAAARSRDERSSERFSTLAMLACAVICCNARQQPPGDGQGLP